MSDNKKNDRLRRAKSELTHGRCSVGSLKNEFRNKFFNRLRTSRSRSVDRFRQIVEGYGDNIRYKSISDLRAALLLDTEARNLLMTDEVNDILNEIDKELAQVSLQNEGDQYIHDSEVETQDIINRHLTQCSVCDKLTTEGSVCAGCLNIFKSNFN